MARWGVAAEAISPEAGNLGLLRCSSAGGGGSEAFDFVEGLRISRAGEGGGLIGPKLGAVLEAEGRELGPMRSLGQIKRGRRGTPLAGLIADILHNKAIPAVVVAQGDDHIRHRFPQLHRRLACRRIGVSLQIGVALLQKQVFLGWVEVTQHPSGRGGHCRSRRHPSRSDQTHEKGRRAVDGGQGVEHRDRLHRQRSRRVRGQAGIAADRLQGDAVPGKDGILRARPIGRRLQGERQFPAGHRIAVPIQQIQRQHVVACRQRHLRELEGAIAADHCPQRGAPQQHRHSSLALAGETDPTQRRDAISECARVGGGRKAHRHADQSRLKIDLKVCGSDCAVARRIAVGASGNGDRGRAGGARCGREKRRKHLGIGGGRKCREAATADGDVAAVEA